MASQPPFPIPLPYVGKAGLWYEKAIPPYSDGEQRHWPAKPKYRPGSDGFYRTHLAGAWAEATGTAIPNAFHYLDSLPKGYGVFETDSIAAEATHVYRRLFGHPSGKFYDSVVRFQVHFLWLMSGMEGDCECVLCSKKQPKPTISRQRQPRELVTKVREDRGGRRRPDFRDGDQSTRSNSAGVLGVVRPRRELKQAAAPSAVDEEGTEDVFKNYIQKLHQSRDSRNGLHDDIVENTSIDWRAERASLPAYLTQIDQEHSFVPRIGELVLFCNYFPHQHYLMLNSSKAEYKFYSFDQQQFHGFPDWRGGVITATPTLSSGGDGPIDFSDILGEPDKRNAVNLSGFRVETFPDPNGFDKSLSKQYRYIPLRQIRPLSHWQFLLRGIPEKRLHASIKNALTCMTSVSLLEKWWFTGDWPHANIKCKAIYIGSELISIGDIVRVTTTAQNERGGPDILLVNSIRLNLTDMQPEHANPASPYLSSRSSITLVGSAYTLSIGRGYCSPTVTLLSSGNPDSANSQFLDQSPQPTTESFIKSNFRPVGSIDYGPWYPMHSELQQYEVSFEKVLGRVYEPDAVRLWTGMLQTKAANGHSPPKPSLDYDQSGIESARRYATLTDARIPEPTSADQVLWHWADTRAQGLAIATSNGLEVGRYHTIRDKATLRAWRAQLRVLDGVSVTQIGRDTGLPIFVARGRKVGGRLVNGKYVLPSDDDQSDTRAISHSPAKDAQKQRESEHQQKGKFEGVLVSSQQSSKRAKASRMIGAAHEDTDDEALNLEDEAEDLDMEKSVPKAGGDEMQSMGGRAQQGSHGRIISQSPQHRRQSQTHIHSPYHPITPRKSLPPPPTKAQIMSNAEVNLSDVDEARSRGRSASDSRPGSSSSSSDENGNEDDDDDDNDSDDNEDDDDEDDEMAFLQQPPIIRGGTEEAEGGDYDPRAQDQET